jgi:hypothetical protein
MADLLLDNVGFWAAWFGDIQSKPSMLISLERRCLQGGAMSQQSTDDLVSRGHLLVSTHGPKRF